MWIWDSWYAHDGTIAGTATSSRRRRALINPELRHFNVSQGHAVIRRSHQLGASRHLPGAVEAGPAWDDFTTWTGSVVRTRRGLWHLFYTGDVEGRGRALFSGSATRYLATICTQLDERVKRRALPRSDRARMRALRACTNHDAGFWHDRAMRDPWVMRDPEGERLADVLHRPRQRHRRAQCRRRNRLRHLPRPGDLDIAAAGVRRRLRPARGAAGLRETGWAVVLPVLHVGRAFLSRTRRTAVPGRAGDRHPLPPVGDRAARAVAHRSPGPFFDGRPCPASRYAARISTPTRAQARAQAGGDPRVSPARDPTADFGGYVMDPEAGGASTTNGFLRVVRATPPMQRSSEAMATLSN